jgi:glycosyltransferase involved in cell wall biosynthesis
MASQREILVSCLTPTLHSEKYLEGFLRDLELQDLYPNFEVILNMSSPSPEELRIAGNYKNKYGEVLQIVTHEDIQPLGAAWNQCISMSKSDIVAIWNVDDLRTPNSLSAQVNSLMNSNALVSYGPYQIVTRFEDKTGRLIEEKNLLPNNFLKGMHFGPFMAFKKSALQDSGWFDEQLRSGGDFDLSIRLTLQGSAIRVPALLGYYLDAGIGASTSPNSKQLVERTVIELRYGIYDKIEWKFVNQALDYDIKHLHFFGQVLEVSRIPGFSKCFEVSRDASSKYQASFVAISKRIRAFYLRKLK